MAGRLVTAVPPWAVLDHGNGRADVIPEGPRHGVLLVDIPLDLALSLVGVANLWAIGAGPDLLRMFTDGGPEQ